MQLAGVHRGGLLPVCLKQVLDLARECLQLHASEVVRERRKGLRIRGSRCPRTSWPQNSWAATSVGVSGKMAGFQPCTCTVPTTLDPAPSLTVVRMRLQWGLYSWLCSPCSASQLLLLLVMVGRPGRPLWM
jgi:hypothetical protein